MVKDKKSKGAKAAKTGEGDSEVPVESTTPNSRGLQPCSEELRISFNFITRFIKEIEQIVSGSGRQGTRIPYNDVARAQQLCVGLLEQNESIAVDVKVDPLNPQSTALNELARAKREHTDAVLKADDVVAVGKIVSAFPRNITISYVSLAGGRKEYCLRLLTSAEKKAVLKGPKPVINTVGHMKLMAIAAQRDGIRSPEVGEYLKDMKFYKIDLNKYIERFTPSNEVTTESNDGYYIRMPSDGDKLETHFYAKGAPLQKPVVDKEVLMTDQEWRDEAKALKNTLLRHIDILQGFSERAFQFIPGFTARLEAEEIFERLLTGIETLSSEKDNLVTENRELRLAMEKIYHDAGIIDRFCADAMERFPHLQKRYECIPDNATKEIFGLVLEGITEMVTAKDRAIKLNAPLRSEIAELKKKLTAEAEALKSSQDGRDQDRAKHIQELAKKETEATSLLHQAKKAASESDHSRKDLQKKVDQLTVDLLTTKSALALKTTELETNVLDADGARNELEETRKQFNKLEIGRIEWEAEVVRLRKQLEEAQSSLLSSRTNQRVEEDRIQKSVEVATATRDERIKLLEIELNDLKNEKWVLEQARKSDEKNIRELFQDKYALKEKNQELEEKLLNIAAVQQSLEQDLTEGRAKIKRLEEQLLLSRAVA